MAKRKPASPAPKPTTVAIKPAGKTAEPAAVEPAQLPEPQGGKGDAASAPHKKLDPLLTFAALRATREAPARLRPEGVAEPLQLRSVSDFPLSMMSIAAQFSPSQRETVAATDSLPVLVEFTDPEARQSYVQEHAQIAENVSPCTAFVRAPRQGLQALAEIKEVKRVEASVQLRPACDLAHRSAGLFKPAPSLARRTALTGKGVLVGIVDTGVDAAHKAFWNGNQCRVVNYLDQASGQSLSQAQLTAGQGFPDNHGHGTHVTGIASGNGAGSPQKKYAGVAPEADIAVVKTTFQSADIARAVRHLFDLATARQQPCVVNLSLGGHYGGHDGTSVVERTIDQLSGPGRLVVVSAGNEGRDRIHAGTALAAGSPAAARWIADFQITKRQVDGDIVGLLVLQVWHQREDDLLVRIRTPNGELFQAPASGTAELQRSSFVVQADHRVASYSGDHRTTFQIVTAAQTQWLQGWSLIVDEDRSAGHRGVQVGSVHAWILDQEMGTLLTGQSQSYLVGMPGTACSAITVASYATRKEWQSTDPTQPNVALDAVNPEDISYFSSPGPTRDGENKPEIAAPGQWLIAPLSAGASLDEIPAWLRIAGAPYAALQGTSMAAPYVTGAVALLLQKEPRLDWAEAKRRLIKSARQDKFSKPCWNPRWGYGKLDIMRFLTIEPTPDD